MRRASSSVDETDSADEDEDLKAPPGPRDSMESSFYAEYAARKAAMAAQAERYANEERVRVLRQRAMFILTPS